MLMLRRLWRLPIVLLLMAASIRCGGGNRPDGQAPPPSPNPDPAIPVNGSERIGWSQSAGSLDALKALQFVAYVDSARADLRGWTCGEAAATNGYDCSAPLPPMSKGRHSISIAAVLVTPEGTDEARSEALLLDVGAAAVASITAPSAGPPLRLHSPVVRQRVLSSTFSTWARLENGAHSLAPASPARAFLVSQTADVMIATAGGAQPVDTSGPFDGRGSIADLAVDSRQSNTPFVYVAWRTPVEGFDLDAVEVVRYREIQNTFGESARVLSGVTLPKEGWLRLRFGPDGMLYLSLTYPAAGRSSILRFNPDGTTPREHSTASPLFAVEESKITDLAWHPQTHDLWTVSTSAQGWPLRVYDAVQRADLNALPLRGLEASRILPDWDSEDRKASMAFVERRGVVLLLVGIQGAETIATAALRDGRRLEGWDSTSVELTAPLIKIAGTGTSRILLLLDRTGAPIVGSLEIASH